MASLIVRKLDGTPVILDDIGVTITGIATTTFDLYKEQANDISCSADLIAAIGNIPIAAQDETDYDGAGSNGTFAGGSGYVAADTITLSDGTVITVDTEVAGVVTEFTVTTSGGEAVDVGVALTQASTTGAGVDFTLTPEANNVSAGTLEVLDPRDDTTLLSATNGVLVIQNHNLPHFGIQGGRFSTLDAPGSAPFDDFILEYDATTDSYVQVDPATVIGGNSSTIGAIVGSMGIDGTDTTFSYDGTATVLVRGQTEADYDGVLPNGTFGGGTGHVVGDDVTFSDGSVINVDAETAGVITAFTVLSSGLTNVTAGVPLTQSGTTGAGVGATLTPQGNNISDGTIEWSVDDVFLRNTGDTLDSGTLTVASGATIAIATGGSLTIADAPTSPTDAANKAYVDSLASGMDPKESVRYATVSDPGGTYAAGGGAGGTGEFTAIDLTASGPFDGLTAGAIVVGDRLLIKNAGVSDTRNGIYIVTTAGAAGVIERAPDQDGSPSSEVSGGNFTFVENGTTLADTGWVLQGDGELTLNTDDLDWVQMSASTSVTAGVGLSQGGQDFDLDLNDTLGTTSAVVGGDIIGFHDLDGTVAGSGSGSRTYGRTFTDVMADLNIVNGLTGTGFAVQTAADTYATRSIAVDGLGNLDGLVVADGDGVAGDPTLGLDIQNLPARSTAVDTTDRVAVWRADGTDANEYYTISEIAGAVGASDSFSTWARTGNGSGASVIADSSADTVTLDGGIGIDLTFTPGTDTISFGFTDSGMADTAVVAADTVPFFDASNGGEAEFRAWTDIITDLGLQTATNLDTWGTITLTGNFTGDATVVPVGIEDGLGLVGGIGISLLGDDTGKDVTIAFTNDGMADTAVTTADTIPFFDATNSDEPEFRSLGDILSDLNLPSVSTINGQPIMTYTDTTRTKTLSVESHVYNFGENALTHLDWIRIGNVADADSGHIMPLDGTIVYFTAHCENTNANSKDLHLFRDGTDEGSLGTLSGGANAEVTDTTIDIDFSAGEKIRIQAQGAGSGQIEDTIANVTVRWRA